MTWFFYALAAALLTSAAALTEKKALLKEHAMEFSAVLAVVVAILTIPFFFFIDYTRVDIVALTIMFFSMSLAASAFVLVAKSLRHMEISQASPLMATTPGLVALLAWVFLGEKLTGLQIIAIIILIIGIYVLETRSGKDLYEPFRIIRKSKYTHYTLIAIVLYSITALVDRYILTRYNMEPLAYLAFAHIFLAFHFIVMLHIFHDGAKGIERGIKKFGRIILLMAIFVIGYRYTQVSAISIAYVALVLPIKRLSVLITTIVGGELFHEKHLLRKSSATIIIVLGIILLII